MSNWEWQEKAESNRKFDETIETFFKLAFAVVFFYFAGGWFFGWFPTDDEPVESPAETPTVVEEASVPQESESIPTVFTSVGPVPATTTGTIEEPTSTEEVKPTLKEAIKAKAKDAAVEGVKEGAKASWYEFWKKEE